MGKDSYAIKPNARIQFGASMQRNSRSHDPDNDICKFFYKSLFFDRLTRRTYVNRQFIISNPRIRYYIYPNYLLALSLVYMTELVLTNIRPAGSSSRKRDRSVIEARATEIDAELELAMMRRIFEQLENSFSKLFNSNFGQVQL